MVNCKNGKVAINQKDNYGETPLHAAIRHSTYNNFVLLLEYRADPTITNLQRETCTEVRWQSFRLRSIPRYMILEPNLIGETRQKYIDAVDYYNARKDRKLEEFLGNRSDEEKTEILKTTCKYGHKKTFEILNNLAPNRFSPIIIIQNPDYMFGGNLLFIFLHKMNIDVPDLVYIYKGNYTNKKREELDTVINFYLEQKNCSPDRFKKMEIAKKMRKNLFKYYHLKDIERRMDPNYESKNPNHNARKRFGFLGNDIMREIIIPFINPDNFPVGIPIKEINWYSKLKKLIREQI